MVFMIQREPLNTDIVIVDLSQSKLDFRQTKTWTFTIVILHVIIIIFITMIDFVED